ncbi:MAG: hypothetical protein R6V40_03945 [Candidatus Moraniibacteriota bacterium]
MCYEISNAEILRLLAHAELSGKPIIPLKEFHQKMKMANLNNNTRNVRLDYLTISLLSSSSGLAIVSNKEKELVITQEENVRVISTSNLEKDYYQEIEKVLSKKNTKSKRLLMELLSNFKQHKEISLPWMTRKIKANLYLIPTLVSQELGIGAISPEGEKEEIFFSPYYISA